MLYTVIIKKKLIIDADNADEARILAALGDNAVNMSGKLITQEEIITNTRKTTQSEKIWFSLIDQAKKENAEAVERPNNLI